ncbi:phage antirepressor N-terminal domain-containing protein [Serratia marcescens]|uniref:phage antirepressor N-terminal domain-containing protein n=1 Tax=Serratia marcescens TaxID=615 RepID=UPI002179F554|nr:phage antirepressor N-terminal domain-containing protein [Serratia marcescens]CAI1919145.1 P22_AR N-terminal domain [Serratia marcescens]
MIHSVISVPFHGSTLYIVKHQGKPYVPMRPVVVGMGMDWQRQRAKLKGQFNTHIKKLTILPSVDSQPTTFLCLALNNFSDWMQTVCPNKVKPQIRDKVIQYQCECHELLHKGLAKGESQQISARAPEKRPPLQTAVNRIAHKYGIPYQAIYKMIHRQFGTKNRDEFTEHQSAEAIDYLLAKVINGEFLGKREAIPQLSYSMEWFKSYRWIIGDKALSAPWCYPAEMLIPNGDYPNPCGRLLVELKRAGYQVEAAMFQLKALQHHLEVFRRRDSTPAFDFGMYARNASVARKHFKFIWQVWCEQLDPSLRAMDSPIAVNLLDHLKSIGAITYGLSVALDKAAKNEKDH